MGAPMTKLTAETLRSYIDAALDDTPAADVLRPYANELERLQAENTMLGRAFRGGGREILEERERMRSGLQRIKARYLKAVANTEPATGALVVELANYAAEVLPGLPTSSAPPAGGGFATSPSNEGECLLTGGAGQITTVAGLEQFLTHKGRGSLDTAPGVLLDCPFCGHDAAFTDRGKVGHDHYTVAAQCSNTSCGVRTPEHYTSRETAAEAWNRRPNRPEQS